MFLIKIVYEFLKDIREYENNPRFNDEAVDKVINSIKEFGFKVPIIVDKSKTIIAGHTRYKASKKLGLEKVPVIIADDLTEEQVKAFRLADNKVAEFSEWDDGLLKLELVDIGLDMNAFGFNLDLNFDDIPDSLEIERIEDDGEKETLDYLKYDDKKIPLTTEEIELLNKRYDTYVQDFKTNYGFIKYLLGDNIGI